MTNKLQKPLLGIYGSGPFTIRTPTGVYTELERDVVAQIIGMYPGQRMEIGPDVRPDDLAFFKKSLLDKI